jgi:hypothetical protein
LKECRKLVSEATRLTAKNCVIVGPTSQPKACHVQVYNPLLFINETIKMHPYTALSYKIFHQYKQTPFFQIQMINIYARKMHERYPEYTFIRSFIHVKNKRTGFLAAKITRQLDILMTPSFGQIATCAVAAWGTLRRALSQCVLGPVVSFSGRKQGHSFHPVQGEMSLVDIGLFGTARNTISKNVLHVKHLYRPSNNPSSCFGRRKKKDKTRRFSTRIHSFSHRACLLPFLL